MQGSEREYSNNIIKLIFADVYANLTDLVVHLRSHKVKLQIIVTTPVKRCASEKLRGITWKPATLHPAHLRVRLTEGTFSSKRSFTANQTRSCCSLLAEGLIAHKSEVSPLCFRNAESARMHDIVRNLTKFCRRKCASSRVIPRTFSLRHLHVDWNSA